MKAKVDNAFVDKDTRVKYVPGSEYEGSKSRIGELEKLGFVTPVSEKQSAPTPRIGGGEDKE